MYMSKVVSKILRKSEILTITSCTNLNVTKKD